MNYAKITQVDASNLINEGIMDTNGANLPNKAAKRVKIQQTDDPIRRARMRLSEIERIVRKERILIPPPSRTKLLAMCEDGTFETAGSGPSKFGWLVYEDSFWKWVKSLDSKSEE